MTERYEIKGRLGRGGVGAVYQAYDHHLGRDIAIKRLLPLGETKLNESTKNSLALEAKTLATFTHPNIVTIHEFGEDEKGAYAVIELIDGDTLKELISQGALSEVDFYEVASQILDGLIAAQERGILHRDLKPANIMLTWLPSGKFQVKILDFGLSKFSEKPSKQTLDHKGSFLGSIDYIAPEQIELLPLDQRTDLYSLGCVFYFALTQTPPFKGSNMAKTMNNHLTGKVTPLEEIRPDLPIAVSRWVMRLLSKNPADRPANALEALKELKLARETSNQALTESIPSPKLNVPIVGAAQPTMQSRQLEDTREIVSTPNPPKELTIQKTASNPDSVGSDSKPTNRSKKSWYQGRGAILGLAGTLSVLGIAASLMFANNKATSETVLSAEPGPSDLPVVKYVNSGTSTSPAQLPGSESLVAFYSVRGVLQDQKGAVFASLESKERLGAIENSVPGAHRFHLLKCPIDPSKAPRVGKNWNNQLTLIFKPGEKLTTPHRPFIETELATDQLTIAMLYRVPKECSGTMLRLNLPGSPISKLIRLTFNPDTLILASDQSDEKIKDKLVTERYRVLIIEYDGKKSNLKMWQRGRGGKNLKLAGGVSIPLKGSGMIRPESYEIGHLVVPAKQEMRKRIEIPVLSIHKTVLSDKERRELAAELYAAAFPGQ